MLDKIIFCCLALAILWEQRVLNWAGNTSWSICGLLVPLSCALALWLWARGQRRPAPPAYPGALPLIGNAHQFYGDELHLLEYLRIASSYCLEKGGVITISVGLQRVYGITDPDDLLTVANACLGKPYVYNFAKKWLGNGLVTADEKTWKLHRKALNPAFSQKMLNMFTVVFNDQSRALVDQLRDRAGTGLFDVEPYLLTNLMESIYRTSLNIRPEENKVCYENYITAINHLTYSLVARLQKVWLHPQFLYNLSSLKKKHDKYRKIVVDVSGMIVQNRKQELKEINAFNMNSDEAIGLAPNQYAMASLACEALLEHNAAAVSPGESTGYHCKTLLDLLLHLATEQGVFTDSDIMEHLNTFIFAGTDTTGPALTITLVLLGSHQDVQERVYKELQEVLGDSDEDIDSHVLTKLVYLEAVLKESMRLYPPVPAVGRTAPEDIKLKNYIMPAGSNCILFIYGLHRHAMWGADAEQFRPERWLQPGGVPDRPNAFASFSIGRRNCIGKQYAIMSMKTTLAHLLRRYHVTADVSKLVFKCYGIAKPVSGHDISLKLRI